MDEQLEKLKKIELDILEKFIKICSDFGLSYYLECGSCLGAVRHKGFIPWDDDIDVVMPRKDYKRLLEIAQKELQPPLFLQCSDTDSNWMQNYAKIRNSDTTFIESSIVNFDINHGVFIDIFPLDGFDNSKSFALKKQINNMIIGSYFNLNIGSWKYRIFKFFVRQLHISYKKARDRLDKLFSSVDYDSSDMIISNCGFYGEKEIYPKAWLGKGCKARFEGLDVIIPECYDAYLTNYYSNYMEFPPEEDRIPHHFCDVIDLENSYLMYRGKKYCTKNCLK